MAFFLFCFSFYIFSEVFRGMYCYRNVSLNTFELFPNNGIKNLYNSSCSNVKRSYLNGFQDPKCNRRYSLFTHSDFALDKNLDSKLDGFDLKNKYMLLSEVNSVSDLKKIPEDSLPELCNEIRSFLGDVISKVGGHFSGSLGVTELTVALHYVFNSPFDKIVWDIGHQAYVHKILTGRRDQLNTIKQKGGLSGFCRIYESVHDIFGAGHSSTSISSLQGILEGYMLSDSRTTSSNGSSNRDNKDGNRFSEYLEEGYRKGDRRFVCVIGDGGMTGGMAYESLNYAVNIKSPLIVVYNDNDQVSLPTGMKSIIGTKPVVPFFLEESSNRRVKSSKEAINDMFQKLDRGYEGLNVLGPIDGHNLEDLLYLFKELKYPNSHSYFNNNNNLNDDNRYGYDSFSQDGSSNVNDTTSYSTDSNSSSNRDNLDGSDTSDRSDNLDGNRYNELERSISLMGRKISGPLIVHIKTIKGYCCPEALSQLDRMHSIKPNTSLTIVDPSSDSNFNPDSPNSEYFDNRYGYDSFSQDGSSNVNDTTSYSTDSNSSNRDNVEIGMNEPEKREFVQEDYDKFDNGSYTDVFANTLIKMAEVDDKVVAVTAAMPGGTGVGVFGSFFPNRTFDVGICEQHAVTFCGGLSLSGMKPYCALYSTFIQRGFDQVIHDIVIQNLPVRFVIDRAGYVGEDGLSHHGNYDLNFFRVFKNVVTMSPSNQIELALMLKLSSVLNQPSVIRYPKDKVPNRTLLNYYPSDLYDYIKYYHYLRDSQSHYNLDHNNSNTNLNNGDHFNYNGYDYNTLYGNDSFSQDGSSNRDRDNKDNKNFNQEWMDFLRFNSKVVRKGKEVAILSLGPILFDVLKAVERLGIDPTVVDMRFLNPLDVNMLKELENNHKYLITVEESVSGGLGTSVLEYLADSDKLSLFKVKSIRYPYEFVHHATRQQQKELAQIDSSGIENQIRDFLNN